VVSGSRDKSLRVWDVATGVCVQVLDRAQDDVGDDAEATFEVCLFVLLLHSSSFGS
jgi:WD40 repeat protein